jgi:anti-sigma regulatory factor (Ser/Thr protein kinase)
VSAPSGPSDAVPRPSLRVVGDGPDATARAAADAPPWERRQGTEVELRVPADTASLAPVRHVAAGLATALGFDASGVADVRLGLTEVCASLVRESQHVGGRPPLTVTLEVTPQALRVRVRDPGAAPPGPGSGLPLALVAAVTDTVEVRRLEGGGSEIRMTFLPPA